LLADAAGSKHDHPAVLGHAKALRVRQIVAGFPSLAVAVALLCARMREIVPGIATWSWFSERHGYDFNGYFVRRPPGGSDDRDGNLVIDPVEPSDDVLRELVAAGVARIVLTNRNHYRAAARVAEATGARVAVHPADAAFVREKGVRVDDELAGGDRVGPFVVVPAGGKSPGEIALHWPERRILVVGDIVVGNPPGRVTLLPERVMDAPDELRRSLHRIAAELDFDQLLVGDGECLLKGARAAVQRLVAGFDAPTR
jgi:glyoxylase-like metal-dependent hydrolase (beta-lactamase superfamily II)